MQDITSILALALLISLAACFAIETMHATVAQRAGGADRLRATATAVVSALLIATAAVLLSLIS